MKKLLDWPKDKKIVAIDFDGTITTGDTRQWHDGVCISQDIFVENKCVTDWVHLNRDNIYLILWTCRCGSYLRSAVEFCNSIGIYFDAVNENIVDFECSNKVMADIYIDDKSKNLEDIV